MEQIVSHQRHVLTYKTWPLNIVRGWIYTSVLWVSFCSWLRIGNESRFCIERLVLGFCSCKEMLREKTTGSSLSRTGACHQKCKCEWLIYTLQPNRNRYTLKQMVYSYWDLTTTIRFITWHLVLVDGKLRRPVNVSSLLAWKRTRGLLLLSMSASTVYLTALQIHARRYRKMQRVHALIIQSSSTIDGLHIRSWFVV